MYTKKSLRKEHEQKPQVDRACSVLDVGQWSLLMKQTETRPLVSLAHEPRDLKHTLLESLAW